MTSDNGYIIIGYTTSYGAGSRDIWLIKTNDDGIEEWSRTYGGPLGDVGFSIRQTNRLRCAIGGFAEASTSILPPTP